jgi:O-acetyl-ADP-ribose deacetylase (regulator of RNase III)
MALFGFSSVPLSGSFAVSQAWCGRAHNGTPRLLPETDQGGLRACQRSVNTNRPSNCGSLAGVKVILVAVDEALATAWRRFCGDLDFVEYHCGSILDVSCDAVVSPANSFGFMDGGIDATYLAHFGPHIQERVQSAIMERHHGELPVGSAELVETGNDGIPYVIVAPTMRVPMVLIDSVNAYLAARSTFLLVKHGRFPSGADHGRPVAEKIQRLAFPGLGTGVGQLGPSTCAKQVRAAIDDVLLGRYTPPRSWAEASERHQLLYTDYPRRLQWGD